MRIMIIMSKVLFVDEDVHHLILLIKLNEHKSNVSEVLRDLLILKQKVKRKKA